MAENMVETETDASVSPRWNDFMQELRKNLPTVQADLFGSRLRLVREEEEEVVASVPRPMIKNWLEENFGSVLQNAAQSVYGKGVSFRLEAAEPSASDPSGEDEEPSQSVNRAFPFGENVDLNRDYTFENFVAGSGNEYAYTAARAIADDPTNSYNPLFIYGGVGLGKTHLLQAVGHKVKERWQQANVQYISAEQFTNEIINAMRDNNKKKEFKYRYRNIDMFLVDDVQFFAKTDHSQEEFFHTFNTLYENGKGTVFCSDRPPQDIPHIEERLRNRFEMGLMVDIQPPDYETRLAILQSKAEQEGLNIPHELLDWVARNVTRNVRRLEGCLTRLAMMGSLNGDSLDLEQARARLQDLVTPEHNASPVLTFDQVMDEVSEHFSVSVSDLKSRRRTQAIAEPRQVGMYLCRQLTNRSYADIGQEFGGRDHSTVMHAEQKIQSVLEDQTPLARHVRTLKQKLSP